LEKGRCGECIAWVSPGSKLQRGDRSASVTQGWARFHGNCRAKICQRGDHDETVRHSVGKPSKAGRTRAGLSTYLWWQLARVGTMSVTSRLAKRNECCLPRKPNGRGPLFAWVSWKMKPGVALFGLGTWLGACPQYRQFSSDTQQSFSDGGGGALPSADGGFFFWSSGKRRLGAARGNRGGIKGDTEGSGCRGTAGPAERGHGTKGPRDAATFGMAPSIRVQQDEDGHGQTSSEGTGTPPRRHLARRAAWERSAVANQRIGASAVRYRNTGHWPDGLIVIPASAEWCWLFLRRPNLTIAGPHMRTSSGEWPSAPAGAPPLLCHRVGE